jgi:hypothetical protein
MGPHFLDLCLFTPPPWKEPLVPVGYEAGWASAGLDDMDEVLDHTGTRIPSPCMANP